MISTQNSNHVITWRGGRFFIEKPELGGEGGVISTWLPKSSFQNRPISPINTEHTNIYIYKYIYKYYN